MSNAPHQRHSGRESLLESAAHLFSERGYESVTTREIADRAGVNIALIQYHFGSKAKLFLEVVERLTQNSKNFVESFTPLPHSMPPEDAAAELCIFIREFMGHLFDDENNPGCKLVFRVMFTERSVDPEFFDCVLQFILDKHATPLRERLYLLLSQMLPHASPLDRELAIHSILGQCTFYASHRPILEKLSSHTLSRDSAISHIASYIGAFTLRGLGCSPSIVNGALGRVFRGN